MTVDLFSLGDMMRTSLIESEHRPAPQRGSTMFSAVLHGAAIAALIGISRPNDAPGSPVTRAEPIVFVEPRNTSAGTATTGRGGPGARRSSPRLPGPIVIGEVLRDPPIDVRYGTGDDSASIAAGNDGPLSVVVGAGLPAADEPAIPLPGNALPVYPEELRAAGVDGYVRLRFVVTAAGTVDSASIRVLDETHPSFTKAVRAALRRHRFLPGRVGGRPVDLLVERNFEFVVR